MAASERRDVEFRSGGDICRAWLYPPRKRLGVRVPCVVMAHGFGATREGSLAQYAERFAEDGYFALVFDYRHFGASDGEPRQLLSPKRQLEDWQSAIWFSRRIPGVDPERIALWGSSFSGGHVVAAAAKDGLVAAVSSQCPMMDGRASTMAAAAQNGLGGTLLLTWHGILDALAALFGSKPHTIPIVAPPGAVAAMNTPDSEPGYRAIMPRDFKNEVAARIILQLGSYRPGRYANKVPCPILIQICEKDSVAPASAADAAAKRAGTRAEVKRYPVGHFDVYRGEDFTRGVADQRAFFAKHLT
jgi:fermentation-respiration switch protein FrsA (DUF1100 family)